MMGGTVANLGDLLACIDNSLSAAAKKATC